MSTILTPEQILAKVPQQKPFRFIDEITDINDNGIIGGYTFAADESFYEGHFVGNPVTPGVILLEASAQVAVVAYGIYLVAKQLPSEDVSKILTLFTDAEVEFSGMVKPQDKIIVRAEKIYFRRLKLKVKFTTTLADGSLVCSGTMSGLGVKS